MWVTIVSSFFFLKFIPKKTMCFLKVLVLNMTASGIPQTALHRATIWWPQCQPQLISSIRSYFQIAQSPRSNQLWLMLRQGMLHDSIIFLFKSLNGSFERSLKTNMMCLANIPSATNPYSIVAPGKIWSADDQCKQIHGLNASFCPVSIYMSRLYHSVKFC